MDEIEDPGDLERKIDQASRIASRVNDPTTYQRLAAWVDELRRSCKRALLPGALGKESEYAPTSYGSSTVVQLGGMRSSGSRRNQN
jgi:hypothetical protein